METPPPPTPRTEPTDADVEAFKQQLGRPPRGLRAIAHRCPCGQPDVVETAPRLPDGTPFPTLYYLTCPKASSAIGTLEANGVMKEMTERLGRDPELAAAYRAAHEDYVRRRDEIEVLQGFPSAGGMPDRVKCLHVLVAHSLAAGVLSVGLAVLVARPWGRAEALFAGLLTATCCWLVLCSAASRGYALAVCFALLAVACAPASPTLKTRRPKSKSAPSP